MHSFILWYCLMEEAKALIRSFDIRCFIPPHQKKAISGFKMKTRKSYFHCRKQKDGEKKWLQENVSECDQTLCQCKYSILGREAMSQSFWFCTKMKQNTFVTEFCWLNHSYNRPLSSQGAHR